MNLSAIPVGRNPPDDANVVIEVPIGGEPIKYEMHKASGALMVDRFLYTSMRYPGNYGFIPNTLSGDGDPCALSGLQLVALNTTFHRIASVGKGGRTEVPKRICPVERTSSAGHAALGRDFSGGSPSRYE